MLGIEPDAGAAAQLLGAQRRDVHEEETTLNRRQRLGRNDRLAFRPVGTLRQFPGLCDFFHTEHEA